MKILSYLRPYRVWLTAGIICAVINALLEIGAAYALKNLTDKAMNLQFNELYNYLYLIIAIVSAGILFVYLEKYSTSRFTTYSMRDIRDDITNHILKLPLSDMKKFHSGDLISRTNSDVSTISGFFGSIPNLMCQPFLFAGTFIYMFTISWKLLIACTILIPASSLIYNRISKPMQEHSKKMMEGLASANSLFNDMLGSIHVVKAFNLKNILSHKYEEAALKVQEKGLSIDRINKHLTPVFLALRFIPQLVCPIIGGYLIIKGEMTSGGLVAFIMLIGYIFGPVETLLGMISKVRQTKPAVFRIYEVLEKSPEQTGGKVLQIVDTENAVEFENVSFSYDEGSPVLDNVSFKVPNRSMTAIVGRSGSGKSTILSILCGFYKYNSGHARIFGNEIDSSDLESMRSQISLVSQDSLLFPATVYDNILFGRTDASRDEVIAASKAANAHDFIMNLNEGYDTLISEGGRSLSGGQCQRITLARAILKDAPILLLDEPSSALDKSSESLLMEAVAKLKSDHTIIMVTHRLSTIKGADRIIVMDKGRIASSRKERNMPELKNISERSLDYV